MKPKKTPDQIRREFWEKQKKRTDELVGNGPIAQIAYALHQSEAPLTRFEDLEPYSVTLEKAANMVDVGMGAMRAAVNSHNASKPRPKKKPTHKSIVLDAMRSAQRDDKSFDQFIISAINAGYDGMKMERLTGQGERYSIYCDAMIPTDLAEDDEQAMEGARFAATVERSHKALEGWWTEAKKPKKS